MIPEWLRAPAGTRLRVATEADRPFLKALYRELRAAELAQVVWPAAAREAFADDQFEKQDAWYRGNYPGAVFLVIEAVARPVGRLYVCEGIDELRLMELTLVEAARGRGIGTALITMLLERADAKGLATTLHVETFNPARRLYENRGFVAGEPNGIYVPMRREPVRRG